MMDLKGKVGPWQIHWKKIPIGSTGIARFEIKAGELQEVRWKRDEQGIWIELPHGTFGFDIAGEVSDDGRVLYRVTQRGSHREWKDLSFLREGEESLGAAAGAKKKGIRVRAQMPGKIIRILVKPGASVEKEQPLAVMEAMKMENEIRAPQAGKVAEIKVTEGQAVETGVDLIVLGSE